VTRTIKAGAKRLRPLSDRRRAGRIKGGKLGCSHGAVIDISSGGMRLRSPRSVRCGELEIELWSRTQRITLRAAAVWCKRVAFRKYEVGLQFCDLTDEARKTLTSFATYLTAG
jgi:hypothetical protein